MKQFTHTSASQIDTWLTCRRKWWINKILGLPIPQHPSAALGEEVHKGQERYLEADVPDESLVHRLAKPTLPLLRELRGNVFVERKMEKTLRNGIIFTGRIDVLDLKSSLPRIIDWKTTSDMKYAKTAEELASNVQMLAYAYEAYTALPSPAVTVAHAVIPTKQGTYRYTHTDIPAKAIMDGWTRIQDLTDEMREDARHTSPDDVTPNWNACNAFGGCAFRDKCQALKRYDSLNPGSEPMSQDVSYETLIALWGSEANIPPDMLAKARGPASILPPEAPNPRAASVAPVAATPTPPAATAEDKVLLLKQNGWTDDDVNSMPDEVLDLVAEKNWKKDDVEYDTVPGEGPGGTDIVNVRKKVVAVVRTRNRAAPAAPVVEAAPGVPVVVDPAVPANTMVLVNTETQQTVVSETEPAAPAGRRGRPPGAKNKPKDTAAQEAEAQRLLDEHNARVAAEAALTPTEEAIVDACADEAQDMLAAKDARIAKLEEDVRRFAEANNVINERASVVAFTLLIDCMPEKGVPFRHLDEVIAPFAKLYADNYRDDKGTVAPLAHYLVAPFNKGPGGVAAYVLKYVNDVAKGVLVVDTRSPCAAACLEILRPVADVIHSARR